MLNILGGTTANSHLGAIQKAMAVPGATIHMYGKGDARPGRKMGKPFDPSFLPLGCVYSPFRALLTSGGFLMGLLCALTVIIQPR